MCMKSMFVVVGVPERNCCLFGGAKGIMNKILTMCVTC